MVIMEFLFIYLFCDFRRGVSLHSCEMWNCGYTGRHVAQTGRSGMCQLFLACETCTICHPPPFIYTCVFFMEKGKMSTHWTTRNSAVPVYPHQLTFFS